MARETSSVYIDHNGYHLVIYRLTKGGYAWLLYERSADGLLHLRDFDTSTSYTLAMQDSWDTLLFWHERDGAS